MVLDILSICFISISNIKLVKRNNLVRLLLELSGTSCAPQGSNLLKKIVRDYNMFLAHSTIHLLCYSLASFMPSLHLVAGRGGGSRDWEEESSSKDWEQILIQNVPGKTDF